MTRMKTVTHPKGKCRAWIRVGILLLIFGIPAVLAVRKYQQILRDHALIAAIKKQDSRTAIALLDAGADPNALDRPGRSLNFTTILGDFWQQVRGTKPASERYNPALFLAVGSIKVISQPFSQPISSRKIRDLLEVQPENAAIVQALLAHGANANAIDREGGSILLQAIEAHNATSVRLLLEYGADPNATGFQGPPMLRADAACAKLLLAHGARVQVRGRDGETALMQFSDLDLMQDLIRRGVDVNAADTYGLTALMLRATDGNTSAVKLLLDRGAKVNLKDNEGNSALMHVAERMAASAPAPPIQSQSTSQSHSFQNVPRSHFVYPSVMDPEAAVMANTPRPAVNPLPEGHLPTLRLLLDRGADVNLRNRDGVTALMMAADMESTETVSLLLRHHARVHIRDNEGNTVLKMALQKKNPGIIHLLKRVGDSR